MVSTRGVKLRFLEGEKVLCYEPDPTKAKVLYESKVKDVIVNKDERGRKTVEFLIHFRGWNSSWDRCVSEEFILKDTVENRQLQRDLAQKSKLQFGSYLYRKEQKKKNRSITLEDGHCDSGVMEEDEENREQLSSSEESSLEDESIPLAITDDLRGVLEFDHKQIHERDKLHKLPASPNVVGILETYWKFYVNNQKCGVFEKGMPRFRNGTNGQKDKVKPVLVQNNINILQEFLDGLRIYFDYCLPEILLYDSEMGQIITKPIQVISDASQKLHECPKSDSLIRQEYTNLPRLDDDEQNNEVDSSRPITRRRSLRSYRSLDTNSNGSVHSDSSVGKPTSAIHCHDNSPLLKIPMWKALPDYVYAQEPKPPCLQYGAMHLARLFVKLPEILGSTEIVENKLKVLISHLESFMEFLGEHKEWFTDDAYITGITANETK